MQTFVSKLSPKRGIKGSSNWLASASFSSSPTPTQSSLSYTSNFYKTIRSSANSDSSNTYRKYNYDSFKRHKYWSVIACRNLRWEYPSESPYTVLGVTKSATPKEIKMAYFKLAKKFHPDINSEPEARKVFQKLANAYEILSDETHKNRYDSKHSSSWGSSTTETANEAYNRSSEGFSQSSRHAEDVFTSVLEDMETIKEALVLYAKDFEDEVRSIGSSAMKGDFNAVGQFIKNNKFIILGVAVPLVVFTRSPVALVLTARVLLFYGNIMMTFLIKTGQIAMAVPWIWSRMVALAKSKKSKSKK